MENLKKGSLGMAVVKNGSLGVRFALKRAPNDSLTPRKAQFLDSTPMTPFFLVH